MIALLFPLLAFGAIAYLASRRHVDAAPTLAIATTSGAPAPAQSDAPSPLVVLDGFLRMGQQPPPLVISCAIAEAETLGRLDVAFAIIQSFVLPVVAADERRRGRGRGDGEARAPGFGGGAPMPASSHRQPMPPFGQIPFDPSGHRHPSHRHQGQGHHQHQHQHPGHAGHPGRDPRDAMPPPGYGYPTPDAPPYAPPYATYPGSPPPAAPPGAANSPYADPAYPMYQAQAPHPYQAPGGSASMHPPAAPPAGQPTMQMQHPMGHPSIGDPAHTRVEIFPRPDPRPGQAGPNAGTITVSGRSSPIDGIGTDEWSAFVGRVSRELPTFMTDRHVGQFRQRRDRLAELGIDPSSIVGSPEAQRDALDRDMMDAYRHASEAGLVAEYRGMAVGIPAPQSGEIIPIEVTLSGVMGVIQAAGLEGAAGWLERPDDRRRFAGTTAAFLRTNGVF